MTTKPLEILTESGSGWKIDTVSYCQSEVYFTIFQRETDTNEEGAQTFFWFVDTYSLDQNGFIKEMVNNTGILDTYSEAEQNYSWHLDLYHGRTLEEVMGN
jgi:hypothetical protein